MGNALKMAAEGDLVQDFAGLGARDLGQRLTEPTPDLQRAIWRPVLVKESGESANWWGSAAIFRDLSLSECQQILSSAIERDYAGRQTIVREGDLGGEVLLVASGRVKVTQISHTGDEVILRVRRSGDLIGGIAMLPGEAHSSTIQALEACRVLSWKVEHFDALCKRLPTLQRNALQILKDTLQILQECFCELATLRVPSRLARTLVRLADQRGSGVAKNPINFTCEELGQMTGTTLFTVSRLLCKWTELGLIDPESRGFVIRDLDGLLAIADACPMPPAAQSAR
jgi:CRP-like cAMP-binding protein